MVNAKTAAAVAIAALCLSLAAGRAAIAADDSAQFKADLENFLGHLGARTHGFVRWDGAEHWDVRQDGAAAIADFANARITIASPDKPQDAVQLALDHVEIRRSASPDGSPDFAVRLPHRMDIRAREGRAATLDLDDGTAQFTLDRDGGSVRDTAVNLAAAHFAIAAEGIRVDTGSLSLSSKMLADDKGGWSAPAEFLLNNVQFAASNAPLDGSIAAIRYTAHSAGPDLAAIQRLRARWNALAADENASPDERLRVMADTLPEMLTQFGEVDGELAVESVRIGKPEDKTYAALDRASFGGRLTGLSGDEAAWRFTLREDGLRLAPSALEPGKVPSHLVADFSIEKVSTAPLRTMIENGLKIRDNSGTDKSQAMIEAFGAAARLTPTLRLYDLTIDTPDLGVAATGEASGSPIAATGYRATADASVRGFAALPEFLNGSVPEGYLPVLEMIGRPAAAADGSPRLGFHLDSTPPLNRLIVNGSNLSTWFAPSHGPGPEGPGVLRPGMNGAGVRAVQKALVTAGLKVPQNGDYDAATAAAVARFQQANGLNVDGVVDPATRGKLGIPEQPAPSGAKPRAN